MDAITTLHNFAQQLLDPSTSKALIRWLEQGNLEKLRIDLLAYLDRCGKRFSGQVVFVTGGTSGIGQTVAAKFALEGAERVIVCGRTQKKWEQTQKYLREHRIPDVIEYHQCDVRVESQVRDLLQWIVQHYHRLDICINNAGVQPVWDGDIAEAQFSSALNRGALTYSLPSPGKCGETQTTPVSEFCESPIATTAFGVMYCLKWEVIVARLLKRPMAIVNTASRMGVLPSPKRPIYAASKAFILSLTRSIGTQVAKDQIRVNAVSPGPVDTPLERAAFPDGKWPESYKGVPMNRATTPEEIAPIYLFLADSKQSGYVTGSNYLVDGGFTAAPILD